jgi:outer membrane protein TolC
LCYKAENQKMKTSFVVMLKLVSVCVCWLLIAADVLLGQASKMSLEQCIDYAVNNKSTVIAAKLDEAGARGRVREVLGAGIPQADASIQLVDNIKIPTTLIPGEVFGGRPGVFIPVQFGVKYNATVGLNVNWLAFDFTYFLGVRAARMFAELQQRNTERSRIETAAAVAKAYYAVLVNEKRIGLLEANIKRAEQVLKDTRALYENGLAEKVDVDRIQVTVNNLHTDLEKIQSLIDLSYNLLKFQMGMDLNTPLGLSDTITGIFEETELADTPVEAVAENRIEFKLLQQQRKLQELEIRRHKVGYLPNLVMFGSLQTQAFRQKFDFYDTDQRWFAASFIGLKIGVPVFDGFQKAARIQQAEAALAKTDQEIKNFKQAVNLESANARIQILNSLKTMIAQKRNMELAAEVLRVTALKYKEGVGSNLEVVEAESSYKIAENNYINAVLDVYIAKIDLQKANGTLYAGK